MIWLLAVWCSPPLAGHADPAIASHQQRGDALAAVAPDATIDRPAFHCSDGSHAAVTTACQTSQTRFIHVRIGASGIHVCASPIDRGRLLLPVRQRPVATASFLTGVSERSIVAGYCSTLFSRFWVPRTCPHQGSPTDQKQRRRSSLPPRRTRRRIGTILMP